MWKQLIPVILLVLIIIVYAGTISVAFQEGEESGITIGRQQVCDSPLLIFKASDNFYGQLTVRPLNEIETPKADEFRAIAMIPGQNWTAQNICRKQIELRLSPTPRHPRIDK